MSRSRATYLALAVVTILVGLLVHLRGAVLGPVIRDMAGDALWAAMVTWWVGVLSPASRPVVRGAAAYVVCVGVELSQLWHLPALDAVRATTVGHLVLGEGFDLRDLAAYAFGVAGAMLLDVVLHPTSPLESEGGS